MLTRFHPPFSPALPLPLLSPSTGSADRPFTPRPKLLTTNDMLPLIEAAVASK
ncbi:Hypothetical protein conserved in the Yarrowia clade [Yarrowia lipolytica]|nr:Hypothetical protein conserved in the Yarrowia clade [Yarrowia lipolytica]